MEEHWRSRKSEIGCWRSVVLRHPSKEEQRQRETGRSTQRQEKEAVKLKQWDGYTGTTTKAHRPYRDFQRAVHHIIDTSRRPRLGGIVRGKARNDASEGSKWRVYEPWPAAKQPRQKRMSRSRKDCERCAKVCVPRGCCDRCKRVRNGGSG